ncbi:hypothetical protein [Enterobacter vonholyi]|uniref:hypothetical protein n=1 Tax=Enterobacter vonholyi TaxID=2797505 RepID=UPI001F0396B3|nr:hypothetical protein [Enterobacter vonholyi]
MAKNYAQDGKTIPLVNSGATDVHSGDLVINLDVDSATFSEQVARIYARERY